jgi:uncharacterized membrane protein
MPDQQETALAKPSLSTRLSAVLAIIIVLYPFIVYFGFRYSGPRLLAAVLIGMFTVRLILSGNIDSKNHFSTNLRLIAGAGAVLAIFSFIGNSPNAMLYYPVIVNALLLVFFVHSLSNPPTVIERFARLRQKDLPQHAIAYTRKATIAWAAFFLVNGSIALYTVLASSLEVWTLFNGLVSYILIGCMFVVEYAIRSMVKRRNPK